MSERVKVGNGAATDVSSTSKKASPKRAVLAASIGNLMEQYDNMVYGYSAVWIGMLFFPKVDTAAAVLYTFAIFAVGFLARPLGTLAFGHYGDRVGRKPALVLSVIMMGTATVLIGLLPTFDSIGIVAPILLVLFRLIQGFSVAGEWAGSATMLVEYAPKEKRGFFGSFNQVSTAAGFLVAAGVVAVNSAIFNEEAMLAGGWRVPFLLGAVTAIIALFMRFGLDDTPSFREESEKGNIVKFPVIFALKTQFGAIARGFGFTVVWGVAYYFFLTYMPTYLTQVAGVEDGLARASNLVAIAVFTVAILFAGKLSDRIGRKPLLLVGAGGFVVLSYPVLMLFNSGSIAAVFAGQVIIALVLAAFSGPGPAALCELFPTNVRYSALGIGYNFSVMAFGGTAPFVATGLVALTGSQLSPALLPTIAGFITLIVVFSMPESYKMKLR